MVLFIHNVYCQTEDIFSTEKQKNAQKILDDIVVKYKISGIQVSVLTSRSKIWSGVSGSSCYDPKGNIPLEDVYRGNDNEIG